MLYADGVNAVPKLGRRKGFSVKLAGHHARCLHIALAFLERQENEAIKCLPPQVTLIDIQALFAGPIPPIEECSRSSKSIRVRSKDVPAMAALLRFTGSLPFSGAGTFHKRARALEKIDAHDLLADAGR